jgi:glyoxylase-like metal-dependent hydrolase (beta-lactamase superfamily II)
VLIQVAEGVLVHQSNFLQTNAVVVQGRAGVLLIDPGVRGDEMTCLANDLRELGQPVVNAGQPLARTQVRSSHRR